MSSAATALLGPAAMASIQRRPSDLLELSIQREEIEREAIVLNLDAPGGFLMTNELSSVLLEALQSAESLTKTVPIYVGETCVGTLGHAN